METWVAACDMPEHEGSRVIRDSNFQLLHHHLDLAL
jgi:hypothetical protein